MRQRRGRARQSEYTVRKTRLFIHGKSTGETPAVRELRAEDPAVGAVQEKNPQMAQICTDELSAPFPKYGLLFASALFREGRV